MMNSGWDGWVAGISAKVERLEKRVEALERRHLEEKKCCARCSRNYTRAEWRELRFVGCQTDDVNPLEVVVFSLRDCVCGSTLMVLRAWEVEG